MSHVPCQTYKCCLQFNNIATIIFRQDMRYFVNERDDDRYVIIPATGRDDGRYMIGFATGRDDYRQLLDSSSPL